MTTQTTNNFDPAVHDGLPVKPLRCPPPRLTEAELESVKACAVLAEKEDLMVNGFGGWKSHAANLRGLLARCAIGHQ